MRKDKGGGMTNETRALIEAAEAYKKMMDIPGWKDIAVVHRLEAAISSAKAAEEGVEKEECTVTNVDGTLCGLTEPHKLHEFTIAPPDEFFEDEENDHMGEVQFDEYANESVRELVDGRWYWSDGTAVDGSAMRFEAKEKPPERG